MEISYWKREGKMYLIVLSPVVHRVKTTKHVEKNKKRHVKKEMETKRNKNTALYIQTQHIESGLVDFLWIFAEGRAGRERVRSKYIGVAGLGCLWSIPSVQMALACGDGDNNSDRDPTTKYICGGASERDEKNTAWMNRGRLRRMRRKTPGMAINSNWGQKALGCIEGARRRYGNGGGLVFDAFVELFALFK